MVLYINAIFSMLKIKQSPKQNLSVKSPITVKQIQCTANMVNTAMQNSSLFAQFSKQYNHISIVLGAFTRPDEKEVIVA